MIAALGTAPAAHATVSDRAKGINETGRSSGRTLIEPFWGPHQGGILTPQQNHTYFAAFDLVTSKASDVAKLLQSWTQAAARMSEGKTAQPPVKDPMKPDTDSGDAVGLAAARLTITFGFGSGLFTRDGHDRYGLAAHRPEALIDLPRFNGDQLDPVRTGGDLSIQACADDPQVAFHAVRQLARLAYGVAQLRWTQTGFSSNAAANDTPRNLMGFKDGTQNPIANPPKETNGNGTHANPGDANQVVWVTDGPEWMRGGSYAVVRRIRIALEHWDNTDTDFQEQTVGRHKLSGAPLGGKSEFEPLNLDAVDADGNPVIPENAHVRLASAAANDGAQILRRGYSYNDGTNLTAERWPPWHQGLEYDAGLLFVCYQRDPRTGFVKIFNRMSQLDALNQFTTHTGGGLFACPGGCAEGAFIGQALFDAA